MKFNKKFSASNRGIAIPLDLESQVAQMFNKASILTRQTSKWLQASKTPKIERSQSQVKLKRLSFNLLKSQTSFIF